MVISFHRSDDKIAFKAYQNAIELFGDINIEGEMTDYCARTSAASFHEFKDGFEKYMMNLENAYLCTIKKCPKMYRDYRAHMREYYCRQNLPWPVAFIYFWNACMKPKLYREFVVFNETGMTKVLAFYNWLDDDSGVVSKKVALCGIINDKECDIEANIDVLYSQQHMWQKMEQGTNVDKWQSAIRTNLIKLIRKQLMLIKQIPGIYAKRHYFVHEICRVILRFYKCFKMPEFETFQKTFIKKGLEFALKNGIPEGTYLLAQFYPEMFSDDCCPWINVERDEYSKTDVPRLLQISEFYNLGWCHAYWSEEYHMGII